MSNISSNTLFHFTSKAEYLINILKKEFKPRYCLEKFRLGDRVFNVAIPMVCFCDIPLSQIKNHVKTYGSYGIGMTKDWAKKNHLNPVLYLEDGSHLSTNLFEILKSFKSEIANEPENLKQAMQSFLEFLRYVKPYQGSFVRNGKTKKNIKFYNEREWRYTPEWSKDTKIWISKTSFDNKITLAEQNEYLQDHSLSFEPEDIKYVIVKEESEIYAMIKALKSIKRKYDPRTVEILTSRIITCKDILLDL